MQLEFPAEGAGSPSHHRQGCEWKPCLSDKHMASITELICSPLPAPDQGSLLVAWELNRIPDSGSRFPHSAPLARSTPADVPQHTELGNNFPTLLNFSRVLVKQCWKPERWAKGLGGVRPSHCSSQGILLQHTLVPVDTHKKAGSSLKAGRCFTSHTPSTRNPESEQHCRHLPHPADTREVHLFICILLSRAHAGSLPGKDQAMPTVTKGFIPFQLPRRRKHPCNVSPAHATHEHSQPAALGAHGHVAGPALNTEATPPEAPE